MKYIKNTIVALMLGLSVSAAQALTLECKNLASTPISVAVAYLDLDGKTWITEGWYNFEPGTDADIVLESNNDIFYIYGEFQGGYEVSGGTGSMNLPVYFRTFKYILGQDTGNADKTVSFVRGVATNKKAEISFGPVR